MEEDYLKRTGSRLTSDKMKVQYTRNGQYSITIPRWMANTLSLTKGSVIQFEILKTGGIKITKGD